MTKDIKQLHSLIEKHYGSIDKIEKYGYSSIVIKYHLREYFPYLIFKNGTLKREKLIDIRGGKCVKCGYNRNKRILHFHHLYDKVFGLDEKTCCKYSFEELLKESEKCVLLCPTCHTEIHIENF